jgi:hypothetical protein
VREWADEGAGRREDLGRTWSGLEGYAEQLTGSASDEYRDTLGRRSRTAFMPRLVRKVAQDLQSRIQTLWAMGGGGVGYGLAGNRWRWEGLRVEDWATKLCIGGEEGEEGEGAKEGWRRALLS